MGACAGPSIAQRARGEPHERHSPGILAKRVRIRSRILPARRILRQLMVESTALAALGGALGLLLAIQGIAMVRMFGDGLIPRASEIQAMPRFTTCIIGVVSGLALMIAVIGVYGLLAYTVALRMPELGIRLTLGASPLQVSWLMLRQAMLRVLAGTTGGLVASWWLTQWLGSLLFGVRPHDPATFAGVAALLALTSLAAVLAPARDAMKIDPMVALRAE